MYTLYGITSNIGVVQVMRDLNKLRRFFTRDTQVLYYSVTYAHLNLVF